MNGVDLCNKNKHPIIYNLIVFFFVCWLIPGIELEEPVLQMAQVASGSEDMLSGGVEYEYERPTADTSAVSSTLINVWIMHKQPYYFVLYITYNGCNMYDCEYCLWFPWTVESSWIEYWWPHVSASSLTKLG